MHSALHLTLWTAAAGVPELLGAAAGWLIRARGYAARVRSGGRVRYLQLFETRRSGGGVHQNSGLLQRNETL